MEIKSLVKLALRISESNTAFDGEIDNLIAAAKIDMEQAGISPLVFETENELANQAIVLYCKANFGWDNPDFDKLNNAYQAHVNKIRLTPEYMI